MSLPVIIIGAGGHATVVADALLASGLEVLGFTDPAIGLRGELRCGLPILGDDGILAGYDPTAVGLANGIGSTRANDAASLRVRVQIDMESRGWRFVTVRHPTAIVSPFARLGEACQIMASAVIQPNASVGKGSIVNTAAVVEHNVSLADWTHIAPRAVVCGDAHIGAGSHVGAGAVVRQGVRLGAGVVVGIGAAVVKDQFAVAILAGVPARTLDRKT